VITADSNVFIYLWDNDAPVKLAAAQGIVTALAERDSPIGLQVIGEVQNALRRKLRQSPAQAAGNARGLLMAFRLFRPNREVALEALEMMAAGRASYWDALLLASARAAGCTTFLSEDMQDGARFGGIEIVNPFGRDGLSHRAKAALEI
jgi:predicted nucleic acid-binding protein